jgi:hypothetical protein
MCCTKRSREAKKHIELEPIKQIKKLEEYKELEGARRTTNYYKNLTEN